MKCVQSIIGKCINIVTLCFVTILLTLRLCACLHVTNRQGDRDRENTTWKLFACLWVSLALKETVSHLKNVIVIMNPITLQQIFQQLFIKSSIIVWLTLLSIILTEHYCNWIYAWLPYDCVSWPLQWLLSNHRHRTG